MAVRLYLGRCEEHRHPTKSALVFHLSYPSPLALEASADYRVHLDTQAAGPGSFTKWLTRG